MPETEARDEYSTRHQAQRSAVDADQAEYAALKDSVANAYDGIYDELVADALDDFDPGNAPAYDDAPEWNYRDLQQDDAMGAVLERIDERQRLLREHYPFEVKGNAIRYHPSATYVYEFCLTACQSPLDAGQNVQLPRIFEQLARLLASTYLGERARSHPTGWPRQSELQKRFRAAMKPLNEETGEWSWDPEDGLPDDPDPGTVKDEGVDFVVWRPSPDGRVGHLFLLGQCACGEKWDTKFRDIDLEKLCKWFHPMTLVPPVRVFCTPHHVTDAMLKEASRRAGIVFDRARLTLLAETAPGTVQQRIAALNLQQFLP